MNLDKDSVDNANAILTSRGYNCETYETSIQGNYRLILHENSSLLSEEERDTLENKVKDEFDIDCFVLQDDIIIIDEEDEDLEFI